MMQYKHTNKWLIIKKCLEVKSIEDLLQCISTNHTPGSLIVYRLDHRYTVME